MVTTAAQIKTAGRAAMLAGVVLLAGGAQACSVDPNAAALRPLVEMLSDKRVAQAPDCSFVNGGVSDWETGAAAVDAGNGRVSQAWDRDSVLVVDCRSKETLLIQGAVSETQDSCAGMTHGYGREPVGKFFAPKGPLNVSAMGMSDLGAKATVLGLDPVRDVKAWQRQEVKPRNRVNLLCGCEVFYPETMN